MSGQVDMPTMDQNIFVYMYINIAKKKVELQATHFIFQIRISNFAAGLHSNVKLINNKSVHSSA